MIQLMIPDTDKVSTTFATMLCWTVEAMLVKRLSAAAVLPQRGSAATQPDLVES